MHAAERQPVTVVLLGAPGSGKGTQASFLAAACGIPAISTGEMLRAECASGSALGQSVEAVVQSGQLVDDKLMNEVVSARLSHSDCANGFILDGYPRTVEQAHFLNRFLLSQGLPIPFVIHLDVNHDEIRARLSRRLQCQTCGAIGSLDQPSPVCPKDGTLMVRRGDDGETAAVIERVRAYDSLISGLVSFYRRAQYRRICGTRPVHEVSREILALLSGVAAPERRWFRKQGGLAVAAHAGS